MNGSWLVPGLRRQVHDVSEQVVELKQQVVVLKKRVKELDADLLDARTQGRRIGEISDLVTELLVSEASRRDPEFQRIVGKYVDE